MTSVLYGDRYCCEHPVWKIPYGMLEYSRRELKLLDMWRSVSINQAFDRFLSVYNAHIEGFYTSVGKPLRAD